MELDFHCGSESYPRLIPNLRSKLRADNVARSIFGEYLAGKMPYPYDESLAEQG